jgi:endonuclease YncB( thermonuclease family)
MRSKQNIATYAISRRRKTSIIVLCLLGAASLVWLDHSSLIPGRNRRPKSEEQAKARDLERYDGKTFTVVTVIDGDTFDIDIPDGKYDNTRIRLLGVDSPETMSDKNAAMYFSPQAAEFTTGLTSGQSVTVYLDAPNPTRGKYGRLLAYVQLPDSRFLNEVLLSEGFAYADLRFRHSFYNRYRQLEAGARSGQKGLWQAVTRRQLPEWLRERQPSLLNR